MPDKEKEYKALTIEIGINAPNTDGKVKVEISPNGKSDYFVDILLIALHLPNLISNILKDQYGTNVEKFQVLQKVHERKKPHAFFYLDMYTDQLLGPKLLKEIAELALEDVQFNNQFWVVAVEPLTPRRKDQ